MAYIIFVVHNGKYFIETVTKLDIHLLKSDCFDIELEMDYHDWEEVMNELNSPTIKNGECLAVRVYIDN